MSQTRYLTSAGRCLLMVCSLSLAGCRSRMVEVTIVNQGPALHLMEFDYPSASFGANGLATGASYHYRIKVQGPGPVSLQYEDAQGHSHTSTGPKVDMGEEGSLLAQVNTAGRVTWNTRLTNSK